MADTRPMTQMQGAPSSLDTKALEPNCFHLQNEAALKDGTLASVLSSHLRPHEFSTEVAQYCAYLCSLVADDLTSPRFCVTQKLRWTTNAELHKMDGPLQMECLCMQVGEYCVFTFRGRQTWRETLGTLGSSKVALDRNIPQRIAIAELHRRENKGKLSEPLPLPTSMSANPSFEEEDVSQPGPKGVLLDTQISSPYQTIARVLRSFAVECVGQPLMLADYVRTSLQIQPDETQRATRTDLERPRIVVTGHGLGGAMAQMCAMDMATLYGPSCVQCYTFGAPRFLNRKAAKLWPQYCGDLFRFVNYTDPLPAEPSQRSGFIHPKNTLIEIKYPPLRGVEGCDKANIISQGGVGRPFHSISRSAHKKGHSENFDIRIHSNYMGIQIAQKLDTIEPFNFVVRRLVDTEPPQPEAGKNDPPNRPELNLAMQSPPWTIILANLESGDRAPMKRRLQAFSGSRQTPYIHGFTPAANVEHTTEDEGRFGSRAAEPTVPGMKHGAQPMTHPTGSGITST